MRRIFTFTMMIIISLVGTTVPAEAIIGGEETTRPYPSTTAVLINWQGDPDFLNCAASVVEAWWVVTNAHCVTAPTGGFRDGVHLRVGSGDWTTGVDIAVDAILPHPSWSWGSMPGPIADIALMMLDQPVMVRPARIARGANPGDEVRLLGWGLTDPGGVDVPDRLQQIDTMIIDSARCAAGGISDGEICVAPTDNGGVICSGDSGGPAGWWDHGRWNVIGGASRETVAGCAAAPMIYTDLSAYRTWIYETIYGGGIRTRTTAGTGTGTRHFNWIMAV